jgi:hypothetical protein
MARTSLFNGPNEDLMLHLKGGNSTRKKNVQCVTQGWGHAPSALTMFNDPSAFIYLLCTRETYVVLFTAFLLTNRLMMGLT